MRYVTVLEIISSEAEYPAVRKVLQKYGRDAPWDVLVKARFEKSDPTRHDLARELQDIGHKTFVGYEAAFEPWEVERAELLRVYIRTLCGPGFRQLSEKLELPSDSIVMDKREMKKKDIALTYLWEIVISERLRGILIAEGLTGWRTQTIEHIDLRRDRFGMFYALTSTNELPSLSPETELHVETHERLPKNDPLFGAKGLFQRGPLLYRRRDLSETQDFNFTHERFGEAPEAHPLLILSQRAWKVLHKHRIQKVEVEPVVILD